MSEVLDVKDMEGKLNQIWFGSYHLKVKLAKKMKRGKEETTMRPKTQIENKWIKKDNRVNPKVTYAQVVVRNIFAIEDGNSSVHEFRQGSLTKEKETTEKRIEKEGVPLKAWSDRCFMELGGLIGKVILVDEDTKITLMIDGQAFSIAVEEEEWRMDLDWWLVEERRNLATEFDSEYSSDGYSDVNLNVDGFLGDEDTLLDEDCVVSEPDANASLNKQGILAERESGENILENGLDKIRLCMGSLSGPEEKENVMQAESGKMVSSGLQHHRNVLEKKHRSVGDIYAGGSGEKESRDIEALWVTERTKSRRERKEKLLRDGSQQEVQLEESLSDGCI
ncbi:hypothetical protein SLEP1_g13486 [Rubroshorea leprosula]|uniref:DUF4283 domain-containing protein n=1 Tax=Rubroshorea leprosula TaxID=152421 RepID=A0AAV5ILT7_9ROSI|nr:hypothetical protein SLEP1_g13486 [Rubroshorea leprosula]